MEFVTNIMYNIFENLNILMSKKVLDVFFPIHYY